MYKQGRLDDDTQIHLCCYHAKQLLVLRNALEQRLDRILNRNAPNTLFAQPEIQQALKSSNARQHVFIVVASPVAEVGRDHDYDWAIVEPSSMRSIIQLAGRIWRHRPEKVAETANMSILDRNIRALRGEQIAFTRPGFEEQPKFKLSSHYCHELISQSQLDRVDAVTRVQRPDEPEPITSLAGLEHAVMENLLNNPANFVSAYWCEGNANRASAHLQKISPFRDNDRPEDDYVCLPVGGDEYGFKFTFAEAAWQDLEHCTFQSSKLRFAEFPPRNDSIKPWLTGELDDALQAVAQQTGEENIKKVARQYASVRLDRVDGSWRFHPWLGFWR
jgi:CRISPR-associated endonuclease/helicase Cas3